MGRQSAPLRSSESQPLDALYRAGQARIQQIDTEIATLNGERRELVSACQGFAGGTSPAIGTANQAATRRQRGPMSAAHKQKLRDVALARKQAGTATEAAAAPPATPTVRAQRKPAAAMTAAG